jgi:hypothetical protein
MRHLATVSLVVGLSASTFACGGTPHDSPDSIVFGAPVIMSCPSGAINGAQIGHFRATANDIAACQTKTGVSTFVNDGAGAFRTGTVADIATGDFEVLDVDGDGLSDIVSLQFGSSSYNPQISFARKDGTFAPPVSQPNYPFGAEKRFSIDGMRNAFEYDATNKLVTFEDLTSDGSASVITTATVPSWPYFADVDGDGNVDMAFAIGSTVAVELGYGHGSFGAAQVVLIAPDKVNNVFFGDVDGDGVQDMIVETGSSSTGYTYSIAINKSGSLQVVNQFAEVKDVTYKFQDVTGDGIVDVVLSQDAQIVIMLGKGDGTFADKPLLLTGPWTSSAYVFSDLNGDGKPDLVVADSSNVSVLLRQ